MHSQIVFLLLTKNEEKTITEVILSINQFIKAENLKNFKIVLADDSSDRTVTIAREFNCEVINCSNKGLGAAYKKGIEFCNQFNYDCLVSLDCDGQADMKDLKNFTDAILIKKYDLVVASRFLHNHKNSFEYEYPKMNHFGVKLLATYLTLMTMQNFTDSHGGIRAISSRAGKAMKIFGNWTYVQESIIDVSERNLKILELHSVWKRRHFGRSKVVSSIHKYMWRVGPYLTFRIFYKFYRKIIS